MTRHRERDNSRATPTLSFAFPYPFPFPWFCRQRCRRSSPRAREKGRNQKEMLKSMPPRRIQRCSLSWIPEGASRFSFNPWRTRASGVRICTSRLHWRLLLSASSRLSSHSAPFAQVTKNENGDSERKAEGKH